jgi:two-component system cell cycle sensor histidine kinase PleC
MDSVRVKQILINLLSNAHKFTPEKGRILVIAEACSNGIRIAVADTGVGMSADQVKLALTPFGQVQSSYSRSHEGTGLGLPIALALAKQHGGDLHISSQPKIGTTVVLTLPTSPPERQT